MKTHLIALLASLTLLFISPAHADVVCTVPDGITVGGTYSCTGSVTLDGSYKVNTRGLLTLGLTGQSFANSIPCFAQAHMGITLTLKDGNDLPVHRFTIAGDTILRLMGQTERNAITEAGHRYSQPVNIGAVPLTQSGYTLEIESSGGGGSNCGGNTVSTNTYFSHIKVTLK